MDDLEVAEQSQKILQLEMAISQAKLEILRKRKQITAHETDIARCAEKLDNERKHLEDLKANA